MTDHKRIPFPRRDQARTGGQGPRCGRRQDQGQGLPSPWPGPPPTAPPALDGLANLRGKVLPIVSLRRIFGSKERPYDDATRALSG